ncbi:Hypothetical predicted protein [Cloeon dipterum]|uniref:Uncharacterized protein n=1 Tax=Cloeon dipterum TaxID=197152 RepID=A0A8S1DWG5_9INSE|nr:Hypothetical predicted protein [Cloeon dipterum]
MRIVLVTVLLLVLPLLQFSRGAKHQKVQKTAKSIFAEKFAPILKKQTKRRYIVKCCGFKRCLPAKNSTASRVPVKTAPHFSSQATISIGVFPERRFQPRPALKHRHQRQKIWKVPLGPAWTPTQQTPPFMS